MLRRIGDRDTSQNLPRWWISRRSHPLPFSRGPHRNRCLEIQGLQVFGIGRRFNGEVAERLAYHLAVEIGCGATGSYGWLWLRRIAKF